MIQLLEMTARREGFGALLAEGIARLAQKWGVENKPYNLTVKGQELPLHEARGRKGIGFSYAISTRGACHLQAVPDSSFEKENYAPELGITTPVSRFDTSRTKVDYVVKTQNKRATVDSLIMCKFVLMGLNFVDVKDLVNATTGWNTTVEKIVEQGERAVNLARAFNLRQGITPQDDNLPQRYFIAHSSGPLQGIALDREVFQKAINIYYDMVGWPGGKPSLGKLGELGIEWVEPLMRV